MKTMTWVAGEKCWVLNGMKNRAFASSILSVDEQGNVLVLNEDKNDEVRLFNGATGMAVPDIGVVFKGTPPTIVKHDDPLAMQLEREYQIRAKGEDARDKIADIVAAPEAYKFYAMKKFLDEWQDWCYANGLIQ